MNPNTKWLLIWPLCNPFKTTDEETTTFLESDLDKHSKIKIGQNAVFLEVFLYNCSQAQISSYLIQQFFQWEHKILWGSWSWLEIQSPLREIKNSVVIFKYKTLGVLSESFEQQQGVKARFNQSYFEVHQYNWTRLWRSEYIYMSY